LSAAAIVWLVLAALSFAMHCHKAGEQRGAYNPATCMLDLVLTALLLWWGGFFAVRA